MNTKVLVAMSLVVILVPGTLAAQGVQIETHDDEMKFWTYAYVRSDRGPLRSMDDRGLVFNRSPHLVFVCSDGEVDVVYLYDTDLLGELGTVLVQHRFDSRPASKMEPWPMVYDPSSAAEIEMAAKVMGVDEQNPLLEMIGNAAIAARLSGEDAEAFLAEAGDAERVTMRVTDQADGETHTDVFSLAGITDAVEQVRTSCGR